MIATKRQVRAVIEQFAAADAAIVSWTKDGDGDSDKVEIEVNGKNWLISVEVDELSVLDLDTYEWSITPLRDVKEVMAYMRLLKAWDVI